MTTTTTASELEYVYPVHYVGERVRPDVMIDRVEHTPGGSQTVWHMRCPRWCVGHNPDEVVFSDEDAAAFDWHEHLGPEGIVRLPGLSGWDGMAFREAGAVHMESSVTGHQVPTMILSRVDGVPLTAADARSLAALLLRTADTLEA